MSDIIITHHFGTRVVQTYLDLETGRHYQTCETGLIPVERRIVIEALECGAEVSIWPGIIDMKAAVR